MTVAAGARLGPYEILALLGTGGMGEVYKARDTRLDRVVAIKVLRGHLADDPDRRARFEREARIVSQLNHPCICALYDVGKDNGVDYLVEEFLEGQSLADRLKKGAVPIAQALAIAIQIADALDAAHQKGIVHRDLKPANVLLTKAGAKLLDFGIAKAMALGGIATVTTLHTLTAEGGLLGTLQYMAPEQLEGREADARSDLFAFGAVLYEMLAGTRAFPGENQSSVIASVLERQPQPLTLLRPAVPIALDRLVAACLAKDPHERWQSTGDLGRSLKWITAEESTARVAVNRQRSMAWFVAAIAAACAVTVSTVVALRFHAGNAADRTVRLALLPPERTAFDSLALSPDGRQLAFTATDAEGRSHLWLRPLDAPEAKPLSEGDDAQFPFWSPDSRFVAFVADGPLKIVRVDGGRMDVVCDVASGLRGGSWNRDGTIILAGATHPLFRTTASPGSRLEALTHLDASMEEMSHRWPSFLPDGRHYLYAVRSGQQKVAGVYVADLTSSERRRLLPDVTNATFVQADSGRGYLLFARGRTLMAQSFDAGGLELEGEAETLAENIAFAPGFSLGAYSASLGGVLVFTSVLPNENTDLAWFDRTGKRLGTVQRSGTGSCNRSTLSADDRSLAFDCINSQSGLRDVWVVDLSRGVRSLVASGAFAAWSPDSRRLAFATSDVGDRDIVVRDAYASNGQRTLLTNTAGVPMAWSPDGRVLLVRSLRDFLLLSVSDDRVGNSIVYRGGETARAAAGAAFSPDANWIAYTSTATGQEEIIVESAHRDEHHVSRSERWQVSNNGGELPRWRRDGKELFYLSPKERTIKSVQITPLANTIEPHTPTSLFSVSLTHVLAPELSVTADGQRFLVEVVGSAPEPSPATVVLNWPSMLKR